MWLFAAQHRHHHRRPKSLGKALSQGEVDLEATGPDAGADGHREWAWAEPLDSHRDDVIEHTAPPGMNRGDSALPCLDENGQTIGCSNTNGGVGVPGDEPVGFGQWLERSDLIGWGRVDDGDAVHLGRGHQIAWRDLRCQSERAQVGLNVGALVAYRKRAIALSEEATGAPSAPG